MKLDEFMEIANSAFEDFQRETTLEQMAGNRDFIGRFMEDFQRETTLEQMAGNRDFIGRFMDRDEVDWFREVRGLS